MRTLAKKLSAAVIALFAAWLTATLTEFGMTPEDVNTIVLSLETVLFGIFMVVIYFLSDVLLAKVKSVFPGDWAEQFWRNQAGEQVKPLTKNAAEVKIEQGQI